MRKEYTRRQVRYRWWVPFLIALYWVLCMGIGCAPTTRTKPQEPLMVPATILYDPNIYKLIIPRDYNGGTWICAADVKGMEPDVCIQLKQLREYAREFRFGN